MSWLTVLTDCESAYERNDHYPFRRTDFALPYLTTCLLLALGEALGFAASPASAMWPLALLATAVFTLIGYGWSVPGWRYASVMLLGFTLALHSESRRALVFDQCDYTSSPLTAECSVDGRVKMTRKYLSFDSMVGDVDIRVMIRRPSDLSVTYGAEVAAATELPAVGDVWRCSGWLERKPRGERKRRRLWVCGYGSSACRVSSASAYSVGGSLRRLRERMSANIGYGLSHDRGSADLDRAMVLGERADLPEEVRRMFIDAGTVHVFAISGLHVGVIAWLVVYLLMAVFFFPLRWVAVPLAPVLCGYVLMIGAPASAVRAAVMSLVYFAAPMLFRRSDSLVAWAMTFMIFHVLSPSTLLKVGSQLSFTVMLGILLYVRWSKAFGSGLLISWGVSGAAWLAGVAIAARVFERITIGGLFANIVAVPLASLAVVLGLLGSIAGFVSPWFASHLNNCAALLIKAMTGISWLAARIPYGNLVVAPWPLWMCAAWYVAVVMTFWLIRSAYLNRRQLI